MRSLRLPLPAVSRDPITLILHLSPSDRNLRKPMAFSVRLQSLHSLITVLILLTVNAFQWGALWVRGNIGGDTVHSILSKADLQFAVCCTIALVFVYLKAIYLVAAAFVYNISLRNPFIVQPHSQRQTNF
jgi:hypothetical protein